MGADESLAQQLRTLASYLEQGVGRRAVIRGLANIVARHLDDCAEGECAPHTARAPEGAAGGSAAGGR